MICKGLLNVLLIYALLIEFYSLTKMIKYFLGLESFFYSNKNKVIFASVKVDLSTRQVFIFIEKKINYTIK